MMRPGHSTVSALIGKQESAINETGRQAELTPDQGGAPQVILRTFSRNIWKMRAAHLHLEPQARGI